MSCSTISSLVICTRDSRTRSAPVLILFLIKLLQVGKKKQRKRVKELVDVLHSDILSDFEDELRNYKRSKSKRKHETIQYTTINIKGLHSVYF